MKKNQFLIVGVSLLALATTITSCVSCQTEKKIFAVDLVTEERQLSGFEEIEINGSPTVYYTQSESYSVKVKGPEEYVKNMLTEVDGKTLVIRNKGKMGIINVQLGDGDLAVYVSSPDIVGIRLNGSGDFISQKRIDTDKMNVSLRGSGDIHLEDMICDRCEAEVVGSGDLAFDALDTKAFDASLVGSGDIDVHLSNTAETRLSVRGSGDIDATFNDNCQAVACELRGSGDITLEGVVDRYTVEKSGSGDVDTGQLRVRQ